MVDWAIKIDVYVRGKLYERDHVMHVKTAKLQKQTGFTAGADVLLTPELRKIKGITIAPSEVIGIQIYTAKQRPSTGLVDWSKEHGWLQSWITQAGSLKTLQNEFVAVNLNISVPGFSCAVCQENAEYVDMALKVTFCCEKCHSEFLAKMNPV